MSRLLAMVFGLLLSHSAFSQDFAAFVNSSELLTENEVGGPICKAFVDVNGDYRDDIVRISPLSVPDSISPSKIESKLIVDIQSNEGEFFQSYIANRFDGDSWSICVADIDNDGYSDILTAGNNNGMKVYNGGADPTSFEKVFESEKDFFAQGSNFVDIDNDGWLDAFVCDDDGHSEIFMNDQQGSFVRDTAYIDMRTTPASDNSGNYGSEWTDVDGDGDIDLYIAKCRLGIDDETDPRRINALFINDNGIYREAAAEFGLAIGAQSWTANFGDIDNDGDQDLFVMNHDFRSQLFENIDNQTFQEIPLTNNGVEIVTEGYQSAMADFNNDGLLDILIVGGGDKLLLNDGNKSFKNLSTPMGSFQTFSFALGDANEDGFIDIMASYRSLGSGLNGDIDRLWISLENENHYAAFSLAGNMSNRSGVGSIIKIYGAWGVQTRIVKAGEGYGITNSLTARFGLDEETTIDSLVIEWPSGMSSTYTDIEADKHHIINEGGCMEELLSVESTGSRLDCLTGDVTLTTSDMTSGDWSNGETGPSITITEPGMYSVKTGTNDCVNFGQTIIVRGPEVLSEPKINLVEDVILCEGQELMLATRSEKISDWSTGEILDEIIVTESGEYFAINQNDCEIKESSKINVQFIDPSNLGMDYATEFEEENTSVSLQVNEENVSWYSDSAGNVLVGSGMDYTTGNLSNDTIVYFDYDVSQQAPVYIGGADLNESLIKPLYEAPSVIGSLFFVVDEPSILKSFVVNSQDEGERKFVIKKVIADPVTGIRDTLFNKNIMVGNGVQTVVLDAQLEPGSYEVNTDKEFNQTSLGRFNPRFSILTGDLDYPYNVSNIARISRSIFGQNHYHYFFDWKMELLVDTCKTDIQEYVIDYNPMISTTDTPASQGISVYPNPFSDIIIVEGNDNIQQINIYNTLNQLVKSVKANNIKTSIELSDISEGHYIMTILGKDFTVSQQLIKTK